MFPKVENGLFVLMRAELATGKILDIFNNYAVKPDQEDYTICENIEIALRLAKSIVQDNNKVECYIYNSNDIVQYRVTIYEIEKY